VFCLLRREDKVAGNLSRFVLRRNESLMKRKFQFQELLSYTFFALLCGVNLGCSNADNPVPTAAPPPPTPTKAELAPRKVGTSKAEYGSGARYQKAMDKLNKGGN
jgi:hypothetical protein